MSGEIEVPETPNWLNDLEAKREQKLKVRLGHEAGAGAPCLKCEDKCPGLDLHFWRKACKICRCPKEEHDVHDDDIYGWAQFQLLGSKPNKIKTKIVLPGKKDEVELEWAPKGHKETIDKYLKTLPPETLPVKGSQAAQERKQLLQKQLPIHDIDPALCHELNEEEVTRMEEYIAHIKNSSVGVGQIVNLSNVIKANLHNISPHEAHIIASKYSTSIPFNEIVNLQSPNIAKNLQALHLGKKPNLPVMHPSKINPGEYNAQNTAQAYKFKDVTPQGYVTSSPITGGLKPQYSGEITPQSYVTSSPAKGGLNPQYSGDITPQNYVTSSPAKGGLNPQYSGEITPQSYVTSSPGAGALTPQYSGDIIPQSYVTSSPATGGLNPQYSGDITPQNYVTSSPGAGALTPQYSGDIIPQSYVTSSPATGGLNPQYSGEITPQSYVTSNPGTGALTPQYSGEIPKPQDEYSIDELLHGTGFDPSLTPRQFLNKSGYPGVKNQYGFENPLFSHNQSPKSVKDLMYSTYDPSKGPIPQDVNNQVRNSDSSLNYNPGDNLTLNTFKHNPTGLSKYRKPLKSLEPEQLTVPEDRLEPEFVNVGSIQDINPDIRMATTQPNPGYTSGQPDEYSPDSIREIINNIKLPDCHYCKKPFEENEFAVTIDRASVLFHAKCFKCAGCNQCLADNIYFYHKETDNVYCGRDYAKIKGYPRCAACDELIFTKEYCLAENSTYHLKHFCCFLCDTPLAGQDYTSEDNKPYCLPCFESSKAAKCSTCETIIKPDEPGCQLKGIHFHADDGCFRCIVCRTPLMGKKLLLRNEKLFCSHDCFNGRSQ